MPKAAILLCGLSGDTGDRYRVVISKHTTSEDAAYWGRISVFSSAISPTNPDGHRTSRLWIERNNHRAV